MLRWFIVKMKGMFVELFLLCCWRGGLWCLASCYAHCCWM